MSNDEILTICDAGALLKNGEKTAYTIAQSGDLPGSKVRVQWRFRRVDLDAWIHEQVAQAKAERNHGGDE